jgi:hypothetical protein
MFKKYTEKTPSEFMKNFAQNKVNVDLKVEDEVKKALKFYDFIFQ